MADIVPRHLQFEYIAYSNYPVLVEDDVQFIVRRNRDEVTGEITAVIVPRQLRRYEINAYSDEPVLVQDDDRFIDRRSRGVATFEIKADIVPPQLRYEYNAYSDDPVLVQDDDRLIDRRSRDEATGEVMSLVGKLDGIRMGDSPQRTQPGKAEEEKSNVKNE